VRPVCSISVPTSRTSDSLGSCGGPDRLRRGGGRRAARTHPATTLTIAGGANVEHGIAPNRPEGHRGASYCIGQSSGFSVSAAQSLLLTVLAVKGSGVRIPSAPLLRPEPRHLSSCRSGGVFCVCCRSCRGDPCGCCACRVEQIWSTVSVAAKWGHGLLQIHSAVHAGSAPVRDGWRSVAGPSSRSRSGGWAGRQGVIPAVVRLGAVAPRWSAVS
jgi:hypothetical protein